LRPIDIESMKVLCDYVNLVPIIAKADSLTFEERADFKKRINEELRFHKIKVYPSDYPDYDQEETALNKIVTELIPFAIVGSDRMMTIDSKFVAARKLPWGLINVEDPSHCEFSNLRNFLMKTHLQDLIETTRLVHYETYRTNVLAKKKKTKDTKDSKSTKK